MYANLQKDVASLANLSNFSVPVHVFTYNVQSWDMNENRAPNRWTATSPDPLLSSFHPITPGEVAFLVLYNEDTVHYDLLVRKDSRLGTTAAARPLSSAPGRADEDDDEVADEMCEDEDKEHEVVGLRGSVERGQDAVGDSERQIPGVRPLKAQSPPPNHLVGHFVVLVGSPQSG